MRPEKFRRSIFGADDYVTKPFGMDELLARMRAALRHQLQVHGERPVFRVGDLSVDLVRRIVKVGSKDVKLSPKEYDLLRLLVQHAGKVLTHKYLLAELWDDQTDAQYLRVYVQPASAENRSRSGAAAIRPDRNRDRLSATVSRLDNLGAADSCDIAVSARLPFGNDNENFRFSLAEQRNRSTFAPRTKVSSCVTWRRERHQCCSCRQT